MWPLLTLTVYCVLIAGFSLAGGWFPLRFRLTHTRMQVLMSLVGGLVLGVALISMFPHATHELGSVKESASWMLGGLLFMFFLVRTFHVHQHEPPGEGLSAGESGDSDSCGHGHDHVHDDRGLPALGWTGLALGLALHSVIDGIALGAAVAAASHEASRSMLLSAGTFLAIALHKPLDSMSIVTTMLGGGWERRKVHAVNALFALLTPAGALLFYMGLRGTAPWATQAIGAALAFSAGVFVCIALADILPEIQFHSHDKVKLSAALLVGVGLAILVSRLEPSHLHEDSESGQDHEHDNHQHEDG